jgi:inositol 1,4,5-triphosphate receptor type 1
MVWYLITDFRVVYNVIYGVTAVIGLTIKPYFFAYHLFDVLVRYPDLLNVIRSVWDPKKSLFLTFILLVTFIYIFSLIGYYFFSDFYPDGSCENTWSCFLIAFNKSFKADGGLGGYIDLPGNLYVLINIK